MLEHELSRIQQENFTLKGRIEHLENIIYGSGPKRMESVRNGSQIIQTPGQQHVNASMASYTPTTQDRGNVDVRLGQGSNSGSRISPTRRVGTGAGAGFAKGTKLKYSSSTSHQTPSKTSGSDRGRASIKRGVSDGGQYIVGQVPSARGCSRSPTRCWAAASAMDRENCDLNHQTTAAATTVLMSTASNGENRSFLNHHQQHTMNMMNSTGNTFATF